MGISFLLILAFLLQRFGTNSGANTTCIERERESLLIFGHSLLKGDVSRLSTWTGIECCQWKGVECNRRNGHVVKLDLRYSEYQEGPRSELSPSLLNLKHLRYLDLSMNDLSGQNIPEFLGSFKRLEYLNLSFCGFGGLVPHHLGNLSRLQYLDLSCIIYLDEGTGIETFNGVSTPVIDDLRWVSSLSLLTHLSLSGISIDQRIDWFQSVNMLPSLLTLNLAVCGIDIPNSVTFNNFTSLISLDLSLNFINSTIPVWLSNLTGLTHLNFIRNHFHGPIPDSLGTLSSLASVDLSENSFDTLMPNLFWNLSSLVRLSLHSNLFHGMVPPYMKQLCNLSVLHLSDNRLSGDLSFIANMSDCMENSLRDLNLQNNQFNGSIPNNLGEFKKLEQLLLSQNSFSGPIPPSLSGLPSLWNLDISQNRLNGIIPLGFGLLPRLENLDLSNNQLSGNIPASLSQLSMLKTLDVSINSLAGIVSELHFTGLKSLTVLSLSTNSLTLSVSSQWIPPFQLWEFGASSCNIGPLFPNWLQTQVNNLKSLDLSNSNIKDTLPEWIENMSNLYFLDLSQNQISGKLPAFHSFLSPAVDLMMNSNKFEGSLSSFPSNLRRLDLSDNLLMGPLPYTNETMNSRLEAVHLSNNRFTGSVPTYFCNMGPSIRVLDLSQNMFCGELPSCLGNLNRLLAIDVTNNTISGVVPSSLGSLIQLESLHLHNNRFEGVLPDSLQNLSALITMDFGNNLLTGSIPFWIGEKLSKLRILDLQSNMFTGEIPLQLCHLNALQYLNLAQNGITGTIPRCFENLSGMITDQIDLYWVYNYEENILASMKGGQLEYTKTLHYFTSLDISSNYIVGEIPDVLLKLVGLKNLNLSRNLLKGQIPMMIGNLKQMESLDLSMNELSGEIPPSLSSLNFLSYLNLSYNNLSGKIPVGNQLQTLSDSSIYEGNDELCGPPLSMSCKGNNSWYNYQFGQDDNEGLWFYSGMASGFVAGLVGLICSLYFIRTWRLAYFKNIENAYSWLTVSILLKLGHLRRSFANQVHFFNGGVQVGQRW